MRSESTFTIYHGSQFIVEQPQWGKGNPHNDYGLAFYCTKDLELAKEWACTKMQDGYANTYQLDTSDLTILNLDGGDYHILNWLAILLENRTFRMNSDLMLQGKDYIRSVFLPDYQEADVIIGYRADDSYFSFANAFLNNALSLERLQQAMVLGKLGEQIAVRSQKAFEKLRFVSAEHVDRTVYYPKKRMRDEKARSDFFSMRQSVGKGTYLMDIIRQQWRNEDERIQPIIFE